MINLEQQQSLLGALGFYTLRRRDGSLAVDGIPGPASETAIREAQESLKLPVTGVWDDRTEELICERIGNRQFPAAPASPPAVPDWEGDELPGHERWWKDIKWFRPEEFMCKCRLYGPPHCDGWPARMCETTVRLADKARDHFGRPGHVSSGLRDPIHNINSGGVSNSLHKTGEACDIAFDGISPAECEAWFKAQPEVVYCYMIKDKNGALTGYVHYNIARGAK